MFELQLVGPNLKELCCGGDFRGYEVNISERVVSVGVQSGTVGSEENGGAAKQPGTYYAHIVWKANVAPVEALLELSVEITGDKKAADASVTPAASDPPAVQQGQTGQGAGQSNRLLLLALAALGVLVVALAALLVVVLRRKQVESALQE